MPLIIVSSAFSQTPGETAGP